MGDELSLKILIFLKHDNASLEWIIVSLKSYADFIYILITADEYGVLLFLWPYASHGTRYGLSSVNTTCVFD